MNAAIFVSVKMFRNLCEQDVQDIRSFNECAICNDRYTACKSVHDTLPGRISEYYISNFAD